MNLRFCLIFVGFSALSAACGETEECKKLRELADQHDRVVATVKARADAVGKLETRAKDTETQAELFVESTGLEMKVPAVTAELEKRAKGVAEATVTTGVASLGVTEEGGPIETQEWTLKFKEPSIDKAWSRVEALAAVPPVLDLSTVIKEKGRPDWRISLQALRLERVPVHPKPYPTPKLDDGSQIPSQFGFCGASDYRAHIAEARANLAKLETAAERTTVLLPTVATFTGLRRRAQAIVGQQKFARQVMTEAFEAVVKAKLDLKAVGHEAPSVVVEVWGEPKAVQKKLETALIKFAERMRPSEQRAPGVTRVFINVEGAPQPAEEAPPPPMPE
ncbi:MAG: hypothetical protein U1E65_27955 [Myxococcota bacterium]